MKAAKLLIVLLAIGSVAAFVWAVQAAPPAIISSSLVQPAMNYAYVRVRGTVTDYPDLDAQSGTLSFGIRDEGGDVRVFAFRDVAGNITRQRLVPMPGDQVSVEGTLRVRDGEPSISVSSAGALSLTRPAAAVLPLAALDAMRTGGRVTVEGQVRRVRDASPLLRIVTLRDGNAQFDAVVPLDMAVWYGQPPVPRTGEWLRVTGAAGEYRNRRQLLTTQASDIQRLPLAREFDLRPIQAMGPSLAGTWVAAAGTVREVRPVRGGARIELSDDAGGSLAIAAFEAWQTSPISGQVRVGSVLAVQGVLTENRGQYELQPEIAADLALR